MPEQRIDIKGWLVAEVPACRGFGDYGDRPGGRLSLFRTATDWTLLSLRTRARYDERDDPVEGEAWARSRPYASLDELRADLVTGEVEDWRALVKAGAGNYDPDLARLWAPVQIDSELDESSVHRRELAVGAAGRRDPAWRELALGLAIDRLEEIGFVVLASDLDHGKVFPRGLGGEWANPIVGALVAAWRAYRVRLVVAIDGGGEVYTRSADTNYTPGEKRRYPPKPMTEREVEHVAELRRRRRAEGRIEREHLSGEGS
jgi:hypothetical protein